MKKTIGVVIPMRETGVAFPEFFTWLNMAEERVSKLVNFKHYIEKGKDFGTTSWNTEKYEAVAKQRNDGVEKALADGCDYIFVTDDDDILPPTLFEIMLQFDQEPLKSCCVMGAGERSADFTFRDEMFHMLTADGSNGWYWFKTVKMVGGAIFAKREVFEKLSKPYWYTINGANEDLGFHRNVAEHGFHFWIAPCFVKEVV